MATLKVLGIGDAGCAALELIAAEKLQGLDCIAVNTNALGLAKLRVKQRILIGEDTLHGLGASGNPLYGRRAAQDCAGDLLEALHGATRVFLVAGIGGGTGSGATAIIAGYAHESGAGVTGVVSQPFKLEGTLRTQSAKINIDTLKSVCDELVVVQADDLMPLLGEMPSLQQTLALLAKALAWQVLARLV